MNTGSTKEDQQTFPDSMAFQRTWRGYQARVLEHLNSYLDDRRFHLVAAPGSGKTVLGLEVIRRIGQPALVLTPTITIRDQWADRLAQHFLPGEEARPLWMSTDLRRPAQLTIATYQALHSLCVGETGSEPEQIAEEESNNHLPETVSTEAEAHGGSIERLPEILLAAGFRTLVVDEAHHLRAEWWKTLTFVAKNLSNPTIIALTATPPYDVSPFEWQRYEELCGAVDAEVTVPELVLAGDLCPHQDYVYFSTPSESEQKVLSEFRAAVQAFLQKLRSNHAFGAALLTHPWLRFPDRHVEEILEDPQYLSSMVVYLNAVGEEISQEVLRILALPHKGIPALDLEWLEILLSHCLYGNTSFSAESDAVFKSVRHELLQIGAIEHRKAKLRSPADHMKLLTTSVTKLASIQQMVRLESGALGGDLRCVILTDFIRKAELPQTQSSEAPVFEDIGVVPIFETLRRDELANMRLGVLSGSLVILPRSAEKGLREAAAILGILYSDLALIPLPHDPDFFTVELHGEYHQGSVRLMTAVFERGGITILVGTKALLGEGWDAPCINTLILASFVGSYVLSNQMRGRSIRVDSCQPQKTANIWHLVCIEPGILGPGADYELLVRRCTAFVGVSATASKIENGTERLGFGDPPFSVQQLSQMNSRTCARALDRASLQQHWQEALAAGPSKQMVDGLKADQKALPRGFVLANTIASLLILSGWVFLTLFNEILRNPRLLRVADSFWTYLMVVLGVPAAVSLPWTVLAIWRFIRHGTPERSLQQIGRVVLESLQYEGSIGRQTGELRVYANRMEGGSVFCWIAGGNGKDQATFLRALREVLQPVENPRYLLARTRVWRFFREDYFPVPELLARKKEFAEYFAQKWHRLVGPVQLVYTRTAEGREVLLRARMHSLAGAFQKRSERLSCWK